MSYRSITFRRAFSAFTGILLISNSVLPYSIAKAEEEIIIPEPSLAVEISPSPEVTPTSFPPVSEWQTIDGVDVTVSSVGEGKVYKYRDTGVTVTFTKVTQPGKLTIKEVSLTPEQQSTIGAVSSTAYDISSSMPDGTFMYNLTLPNPAPDQAVGVKYSEDGQSYQDVASEPQNDTLIIKDLDHFTLFVVANPDVVTQEHTGINWEQNENAKISDNNRARSKLDPSQVTNILEVTDFDLGVPSTAIITGIEVKIEKKADSYAYAEDKTVKLIKAGSIVGANYASSDHFSTTDTVISYGSATDLWDTTWTPVQVNSSTFGVAFAATRGGTIHDKYVYVDSVQVKVHYYIPGAATITITSPNGGEEYAGGSTHSITWTSTNPNSDTLTVDLDYTTNGGSTYTSIASGLANTGSYSWTVPSIDSSTVKIRSIVHDLGSTSSDLSDSSFTVYTADTTPPTTPGIPSSTPNPTSSTSQAWNWTASTDSGSHASGLKGYSYSVSGDATVDWTPVSTNSLTTHFSDGSYTLSVKAEDNNGNKSPISSSAPLVVDTVIPFISFTSPSVETTLHGTLPVYAAVTDANLSGYHFRVVKDGHDWGHSCGGSLGDISNQGYGKCGYAYNQVVSTSSSFSNQLLVNLDTTQLGGDGIYWLVLGAADTAGNRAMPNYLDDPKVKIIVDNTAPSTPGLVSPADSSARNTTGLVLDWTDVTDPHGPVTYEYQSSWTGGHYGPVSTGANSYITASGSPEHQYQWQVRACDSLNNCSAWSGPWNLLVDNTSPTAPGLPFTQTPTNSSTQSWTWTSSTDLGNPASGINTYYYSIPGITDWTSVGNVLGVNTSLGEGTYTLSVKAQDNAGNLGSSSTSSALTVDQTPPAVPVPLTPGNGAAVKGTAFTQTWTPVADAVQYIYQSCNVDPGDAGAACSSVKFTGTYSSASKSVGAGQPNSHFWWRVKAKDAAGNWSVYGPAFELYIDNGKPASVITSPVAGSYSSSGWPGTISGAASDDLSGVNKVEISIYNGSKYWNASAWVSSPVWLSATGTASWSYSYIPNQDGNYTFSSRATDAAGNIQTALGSVSAVYYDTTAPVITWVTPAADSTISGSASAEVTAADPVSGVASVKYQYQLNNGLDTFHDLITLTTDPYRFTWDTTALTLGQYTLRAIATDEVGNSSSSDRTVNISAVITSLEGATTGTGSFVVEWNTDRPTDGRVVYDTVSHLSLDTSHPNYGYAFSSGVVDASPFHSTHHIITISGLSDTTSYYWRAISTGSPAVVSQELGNRTFGGSAAGGGGGGGGGSSVSAPTTANAVLAAVTVPGGQVQGAFTETDVPETTGITPAPTAVPESTPQPEVKGASTSKFTFQWWYWLLLFLFFLLLWYIRRRSRSEK
jgi:hypothetical protein